MPLASSFYMAPYFSYRSDTAPTHHHLFTPPPREQSSKHLLNQPASLNAELVKEMINPKAREWTWVVRNVRIRAKLIMGHPAVDLDCPPGLTVEDIAAIGLAVQATRTLPVGCRAVIGAVTTSAGGESETEIVKLEWTWSSAHLSDATFDMVLRVLQTRMLAGKSTLPFAESADAPVPGSPGGTRPPTGPARGAKRAAPQIDPVVPSGTSVRVLQHRRTTAKFEKHVALAAAALMDEERRSGVVRPPFTIGQVKPFSAWPFGGILTFVQFPFLLDGSWRDAGKWSTLCRKVLSYDKGGRYEIIFAPKKPPPSAAAADDAMDDEGAGARAGGTPAAASNAAAGAPPSLPRVDAAALVDAVPLPLGDAAVPAVAAGAAVAPGAAAGDVPPASAAVVAGGVLPAGAAAVVDAAGAVPPVGAAAVGAAAAVAVPPRHAVVPAVPANSVPPAGAAAAGSGGSGGAVNDAPVRSGTRPALLSPVEPSEYTPLSEGLQHRFEKALLTGAVEGGPADNESVEWAVLERSAATEFSMVCTFSCNLELESRSRLLPSGSLRSSSFITAAYPAKDPSDTDVADLD